MDWAGGRGASVVESGGEGNALFNEVSVLVHKRRYTYYTYTSILFRYRYRYLYM